MAENIDDYLERGMYGVREIKREERIEFLGTFRERVLLALTNGQVMKANVYDPVKQVMKEKPNCHMYLNGELQYSYLSKYIRLANQNGIAFTIHDHADHSPKIGLVLASSSAVNKENIFVD